MMMRMMKADDTIHLICLFFHIFDFANLEMKILRLSLISVWFVPYKIYMYTLTCIAKN